MTEPVVEGQGSGTQDLGRLLNFAHTRLPSLAYKRPLVYPHDTILIHPLASCSLEPTLQMSNDGEAHSDAMAEPVVEGHGPHGTQDLERLLDSHLADFEAKFEQITVGEGGF